MGNRNRWDVLTQELQLAKIQGALVQVEPDIILDLLEDLRVAEDMLGEDDAFPVECDGCLELESELDTVQSELSALRIAVKDAIAKMEDLV